MPRGLGAVALSATLATLLAGCTSTPPPKPLQLDGNRLTVTNSTANEWSAVEIWVNHYYRVTVRSIAAGSRFTVPLDAFVTGFGQRFDTKRQRLTDLRLAAKQLDGAPVAIRYEFEGSRLDEVFKGFR